MDTTAPVDLLPGAASGTDDAGHRRRSEPLARWRRGLGQFLGDVDAVQAAESDDAEAELRLQVMLLREENARLKSERHRPADFGSVIDQLRLLAQERGGDRADDPWDVIAESLVICDELEHACAELQAAVAAVRQRLGSVTDRMEQVARTA